MIFKINDSAIRKIQLLPPEVRVKLLALRTLIVTVAESCEEVTELAESLKWEQLSYLSNCGTAMRIDWNKKSPEKLNIYVNCQTLLLDTYRELFGDQLTLLGNREIQLSLHKPLPIEILSKCIELALKYKFLKKLPLLGC